MIAGLCFNHYAPWSGASLSRFANRPAIGVHTSCPADPEAGDIVFVERLDVTDERTG